MLCGHPYVFTASLLVGGKLNRPFAIIDGAMRFNSYHLAKIAKFYGTSAKALLQRAHLTRSFTAFQTEAAITTKLPRFIELRPCQLVIILGLLDTYYDEQISPRECIGSLERIFQQCRKLTARYVHVLIANVEVSSPPAGKERLFTMLSQACDNIVCVQPTEHGFRPREERSKPLWEGTTIPLPLSSTGTRRPGVNFEGAFEKKIR